jgi:hypothetical protein
MRRHTLNRAVWLSEQGRPSESGRPFSRITHFLRLGVASNTALAIVTVATSSGSTAEGARFKA